MDSGCPPSEAKESVKFPEDADWLEFSARTASKQRLLHILEKVPQSNGLKWDVGYNVGAC